MDKRIIRRLNDQQKEYFLKFAKFYDTYKDKNINIEYFNFFMIKENFKSIIWESSQIIHIFPNEDNCIKDYDICRIQLEYDKIINFNKLTIHFKNNPPFRKKSYSLNRNDSLDFLNSLLKG